MQADFLAAFDTEPDLDPEEECFVSTHPSKIILESKYDKVNIDEVISKQTHLDSAKRQDLHRLLSKFSRLFSGKLDVYPHRKMSLDVDPEALKSLRFRRPYPVPVVHHDLFKQELQRLVDEGVLERCGASPFAAPTFIIPKKDGRIRWVSDFRELNKIIRRKVYPLPKIHEILKKRAGYRFFTKLDISMQYYTFELDDAAKDLCVISTPFGLYRYNRAPMGIKQSPDFAQQTMEEVLSDIANSDVYIDDIGCFDTSWETHLATLEAVLTRLQDNNFIINPLKCEWAVQETDWLGYWLTPSGIRPWKKKVDAILKLQRPRNITDVRSFIGAVTFYRELFPKRSHILAPLYELTSKAAKHGKKLDWQDRHQRAFEAAKAVLTKDAFVQYPDHNKPFHVYTDASDYQLGSVIMQDGKPIAYFSRKLNAAQKNYTTMEKELLSIVYTLNEYRSMLYGCKELHVHTDHKNLTYANLNSQRVLRWRLFLEEFAPQFHYIKGDHNTLADALSRLPRKEEESFEDFGIQSSPSLNSEKMNDFGMPSLSLGTPNDTATSAFSMLEDPELVDCFLNFPEVDQANAFTLDFHRIAAEQQMDVDIQQKRQNDPQHYVDRAFTAGGPQVICYQENPGSLIKIMIPISMLHEIVNFYHMSLVHPGMTRLYQTIAQHFMHPNLKAEAEDIVRRCDTCQRCKLVGRGHGKMPEREALTVPWYEVGVDLFGPWTIRDQQGIEHTFTALSIIDTVTNYPELVRIENKTAEHIGMLFENTWLSRYPRPMQCIYDQGSEFLGSGFRAVLDRHFIRHNPAATKNPQANAVVERLHQTIANCIRASTFAHPPRNQAESAKIIDTALQTAAYAVRATMHTTMKLSPGAMVFSRDMILNIPIVADFELLKQRKQALIHENLLRENRKRISYDYQVGDQVMKLTYKPNKLEPRATGPYPITRVHANGTVTIQLDGFVQERINIRRIKPYRQ